MGTLVTGEDSTLPINERGRQDINRVLTSGLESGLSAPLVIEPHRLTGAWPAEVRALASGPTDAVARLATFAGRP